MGGGTEDLNSKEGEYTMTSLEKKSLIIEFPSQGLVRHNTIA